MESPAPYACQIAARPCPADCGHAQCHVTPTPGPAAGLFDSVAPPAWLLAARRRDAALGTPLPTRGAAYDRRQLLAAYDAQATQLAAAEAQAAGLLRDNDLLRQLVGTVEAKGQELLEQAEAQVAGLKRELGEQEVEKLALVRENAAQADALQYFTDATTRWTAARRELYFSDLLTDKESERVAERIRKKPPAPPQPEARELPGEAVCCHCERPALGSMCHHCERPANG